MIESIIEIKCKNCKEDNKVYIYSKTIKKCDICDTALYELTGGKIRYPKVL